MVLFKGRHANATSFLLDTRALIPTNNERQPPRSKHWSGLTEPGPVFPNPCAHEPALLGVLPVLWVR